MLAAGLAVTLSLIALSRDTAVAGSIISVTRTDDPPPGACSPQDCSLREAVIATNENPGPDTIELPAGVYTLSLPGAGENAAEAGDLDITDQLVIQGDGAETTVIDAGAIDRAFEINVFAVINEINNLTIQNGLDVDGLGGGAMLITLGNLNLLRSVVRDSRSEDGGAFRVTENGGLVLIDSLVTGNQATAGGGGISVAGAMALQRSRMEGNQAGTNGGAIATYNVGGVIGINDSLVAGNEAAGDGGAVYISSGFVGVNGSDLIANVAGGAGGAFWVSGTVGVGGSLTMSESAVSGNRAEGSGGAVYLHNVSLLRLSDALIAGNQAGQDGGGIYLAPASFIGGQTGIEESTISGNSAAGTGGGIHLITSGTPGMLIAGSTIHSNTSASDGGGVHLTGPGDVQFRNLTISANAAGVTGSASAPPGVAAGGGIFDASAGSAAFQHLTIAGNHAPTGGGYHNAAQNQTINGSIIADNSPDDCSGPPLPSLGSNLDSDETCGLAGPIDVSAGDASLAPLADNGGPTPTHALTVGSDAIDAAANSLCPSLDQRGAPRPFDGNGDLDSVCDIGAFEFASTPPAGPAPFLWGDDDCNLAIAATDALKKLQHLAAIPYEVEPGCLELGAVRDMEPAGFGIIRWGDTDCDGDSDAVDALQLLRHLAALPVNQSPLCPQVGSAIIIN